MNKYKTLRDPESFNKNVAIYFFKKNNRKCSINFNLKKE